MILKRFFLYSFLILSHTSKGQDFQALSSEMVTEIIEYKPDSIALNNRIKSINLFYIDSNGSKILAIHKDFNPDGKIRKIVSHNISSPKDSFTVTVLNNSDTLFDIQTMIGPFDKKQEQNRDYFLEYWPDYKDHFDSDQQKSNCIRRRYKLGKDSIINVITLVNGKVTDSSFFFNPYFEYKEDVIKYDSTFKNDTLVMASPVQYIDNTKFVIKNYYFNSKILRAEQFNFLEDTLSQEYQSTWKYDIKGRLILFEQVSKAKGENYTIRRKNIIYDKYGGRIETEDKNPADGRIDIEEKYDNRNNSVSWKKYYYAYTGVKEEFTTSFYEIRTKYNSKNLPIKKDSYIDGVLQNSRKYSYAFYK